MNRSSLSVSVSRRAGIPAAGAWRSNAAGRGDAPTGRAAAGIAAGTLAGAATAAGLALEKGQSPWLAVILALAIGVLLVAALDRVRQAGGHDPGWRPPRY